MISSRLTTGVIPAKQLVDALGVSPATLMRRLQKDGGHVLRIAHEHTSAPIGFEDGKAILVRASQA